MTQDMISMQLERIADKRQKLKIPRWKEKCPAIISKWTPLALEMILLKTSRKIWTLPDKALTLIMLLAINNKLHKCLKVKEPDNNTNSNSINNNNSKHIINSINNKIKLATKRSTLVKLLIIKTIC